MRTGSIHPPHEQQYFHSAAIARVHFEILNINSHIHTQKVEVISVSPIAILQVLVALANASSNATNPAALVVGVPKEQVMGLMRDLRGICSATNNRKNYGT